MKNQQDKKELELYAKEIGKKLGFLIASLNAPNEVKESFLVLIEDFTPVQMEKLTEVLETKFLAEKTQFVEEQLAAEIEKIRKNTLNQMNKLNISTINKINNLA